MSEKINIELSSEEIRHVLAAMGLYFQSLYALGHTDPKKELHRRIVHKLSEKLAIDLG